MAQLKITSYLWKFWLQMPGVLIFFFLTYFTELWKKSHSQTNNSYFGVSSCLISDRHSVMTTPSNLRLFNIRPTYMCLIYINAKVARNWISPGAEAGNFAAYEIHMLISSRHSQRIPHILAQPSLLQTRFQKMQLNRKDKRPGTHLLYVQGDIYGPERKTYVSGRH